jgi:signal peptidase I
MDTKRNVFVFLQLALAGMLLVDSFARDIVSKSILTVIIGILFAILFLLYKLRPDNRRNFKDAFYTLIIIAAAYYIFVYILGLFTGFYNNLANANFWSVAGDVIQKTLIILALEFFRYVVISNEPNSKLVLTLLVLVLSPCDVSDNIYGCNLRDISDTVYLVGYYVVPSILKNIALTYLALKSSYKVTIFYRLIFELPILFLPIVPALGEYFNCVLSIVLPTAVFAYAYYNYSEKVKKMKRKKHRYIGRIATVIITVVISIVIGLVSGFFKYYVIAIGSGSMDPEIKKGDVVFVKKLSGDEVRTLKEGNILVFKYSGLVLVHRIVKITEGDEGLVFRTKGDANADEDTFPTLQKNVIGIALGKFPKIGIPTVWLRELSNF